MMLRLFKMLCLVSLSATLLSGCALTESHDFCRAVYPVYLGPEEYVSDMNARKIMAMDLYGQEKCNWSK